MKESSLIFHSYARLLQSTEGTGSEEKIPSYSFSLSFNKQKNLENIEILSNEIVVFFLPSF